jgi:hypothetical protein
MDKAESDPTGHLEGNFNRWFQDVSLVVGMSAEDVEEFSNASRRLLEKAGVEPLLKSNISMVGSN